MGVALTAIALGMGVMLAGTLPRNMLFAANLRIVSSIPWAVPVLAAYLWVLLRYLSGAGGDAATRERRRVGFRANRVPRSRFALALFAGGLGVGALVMGLRVATRLVMLPVQSLPDLSHIPRVTVWTLLIAAAPVAGLVEEVAFRGYMQRPIERRYGLVVAILITGTMFAVAHLDFTPVLWPYYVAVAAIYGAITSLTDSIWPAVLLHSAGNTYSNIDLLLHGRAEWQAAANRAQLVWTTGPDDAFVKAAIAFVVLTVASLGAFLVLARAARRDVRAASRFT